MDAPAGKSLAEAEHANCHPDQSGNTRSPQVDRIQPRVFEGTREVARGRQVAGPIDRAAGARPAQQKNPRHPEPGGGGSLVKREGFALGVSQQPLEPT